MPPALEASRRALLIGSVLSLPALTLGKGGLLSAAHASALAAPELDSYKPVYFTADEWRFLLAACDQLIPADEDGPGALKTNVPIFIDQQMMTSYGKGEDWYMSGPHDPTAPGFYGYQLPFPLQELYRRGIAAVDALCKQEQGKDFAGLDADAKVDMLTRLQKGQVDFKTVGEMVLSAPRFFSTLLQHTKQGYLADPIYGGNKGMEAWKMINFPGARASYLEWVSRHNIHYPLGPVSLSGEKA